MLCHDFTYPPLLVGIAAVGFEAFILGEVGKNVVKRGELGVSCADGAAGKKKDHRICQRPQIGGLAAAVCAGEKDEWFFGIKHCVVGNDGNPLLQKKGNIVELPNLDLLLCGNPRPAQGQPRAADPLHQLQCFQIKVQLEAIAEDGFVEAVAVFGIELAESEKSFRVQAGQGVYHPGIQTQGNVPVCAVGREPQLAGTTLKPLHIAFPEIRTHPEIVAGHAESLPSGFVRSLAQLLRFAAAGGVSFVRAVGPEPAAETLKQGSACIRQGSGQPFKIRDSGHKPHKNIVPLVFTFHILKSGVEAQKFHCDAGKLL